MTEVNFHHNAGDPIAYACRLLHKAHQDIAQAEDNPDTRELRNRVVGHIDAATRAAEHALHDAEQGL